MTNAEKYNEVFGFPPDPTECPTKDCAICPNRQASIDCMFDVEFWTREYKEPNHD